MLGCFSLNIIHSFRTREGGGGGRLSAKKRCAMRNAMPMPMPMPMRDRVRTKLNSPGNFSNSHTAGLMNQQHFGTQIRLNRGLAPTGEGMEVRSAFSTGESGRLIGDLRSGISSRGDQHRREVPFDFESSGRGSLGWRESGS